MKKNVALEDAQCIVVVLCIQKNTKFPYYTIPNFI